MNARDSEEEPCSRATAKRNNVCPFGRRADDIDDDHDDRGRPRDEMENALGTGHGGCDEETEEVNEADGDDDDKDAHARKAKFAEQKKAAKKRWREKRV